MNTLLRRIAKWVFITAACVSLSGCFIKPYRFDLYQGNIITPDKVAQIQPGMTQEQVRYVLGTPVLNDVFDTERWDYIYLERPSKGPECRRHLAIIFDNGRVAQVTQDPISGVPNVNVA